MTSPPEGQPGTPFAPPGGTTGRKTGVLIEIAAGAATPAALVYLMRSALVLGAAAP